MKKEVLLLDGRDYNGGCAIFFLIGISIIFTDITFVLSMPEYFNINLNLFIILIIIIFGWIINENRIYRVQNKKSILSVSEKGIFEFKKSNLICWEEISEIQIIDYVLSVTVDSEPEKDFKLPLRATDFYEQQMTIDDFVKLINCYYNKNIYTYNSPPSCGCC